MLNIETIRHTIEELQHLPEVARLSLPWLEHTTGSKPPPTSQQAPADPQALAPMIDHTLLKPEATPAHIDTLCHEAQHHGFASVCINPLYVARCAALLTGKTPPVVGTVIGFPLGATTTSLKLAEASQAIQQGASDIDMVIQIGLLKASELQAVLDDLTEITAACHTKGAICKIILETALLTREEKITGCLLAMAANADFVKTSTGFARGGATEEDVALLRQTVGPTMGVKASGGIRNWHQASLMIAAGASRLGTSSGKTIIAGA